MGEHVARREISEITCKIPVINSNGKKPLGIPQRVMRWERLDWIYLAQVRVYWLVHVYRTD
jgi:hypothetical protein